MAGAAILRINESPYLRNRSNCRYEILHAGAKTDSEPIWHLIFGSFFKNPLGMTRYGIAA